MHLLYSKFFKFFIFLITVIALYLLSSNPVEAHKYTKGDLIIIKPHFREPPPGALVVAGYVEIKNNGTKIEKLLNAKSNLSNQVEIHEMLMDDGVMRMRPITDGIEIDPGKSIKLEKGSYHLMFIEPKNAIKEGESYKVTLIFKNQGVVEI